jgi:hypothetical protein
MYTTMSFEILKQWLVQNAVWLGAVAAIAFIVEWFLEAVSLDHSVISGAGYPERQDRSSIGLCQTMLRCATIAILLGYGEAWRSTM